MGNSCLDEFVDLAKSLRKAKPRAMSLWGRYGSFGEESDFRLFRESSWDWRMLSKAAMIIVMGNQGVDKCSIICNSYSCGFSGSELHGCFRGSSAVTPTPSTNHCEGGAPSDEGEER